MLIYTQTWFTLDMFVPFDFFVYSQLPDNWYSCKVIPVFSERFCPKGKFPLHWSLNTNGNAQIMKVEDSSNYFL